MRAPDLLPALLLLTPLLPAQGGQGLLTVTSAGLLAQVGTTQPIAIAPGLDVTAGLSRLANGAPGSASFRVDALATTTSLDVSLAATANAQSSGLAQGLGEVLVHLGSPVDVPGILGVTWTPAASGSGTTSCRIDLGDDGLDLATGTVAWSVSLGPSPVPLRLRVETAASAGWLPGAFGSQWHYSGAAAGVLQVHFTPTHCVATPFAPGCGEPVLAVHGNLLGGADLVAECAAGTALGAAVLGFAPAAAVVPLPPQCVLSVAPVVVSWGVPDPQHTLRFPIAIPPVFWPVTFRAQVLGFDPLLGVASTSLGYTIDCR